MNFEPSGHDEFLELCAISVSNRLTLEERSRLDAHLNSCPGCREALEQYRSLEEFGLPMLTDELAAGEEPHLEVSQRRHDRVLRSVLKDFRRETKTRAQGRVRGHGVLSPRMVAFVSSSAGFAAAMVLAGCLYYFGGLHNQARISETAKSAKVATVVPPKQGQTAAADSQASNQLIAEENEREAKLKAKLELQDEEIQRLRKEARGLAENQSRVIAEGQRREQERESLAANLVEAEQEAARMKGDLSSLREQERKDVSDAVASRESTIGELNRLLQEREQTISQQQELLASDRDIRELMGARDLYITEVHDVARDGKTEKPFARVFYTKGKSLIFYAYDLSQREGIKNASTFQAWGLRGNGEKQAVSLGILYSDNVAKRRWKLKFDNPKTLEQIDAVFITVEPHGGSRTPSGKQLLFAYLRVQPNHP